MNQNEETIYQPAESQEGSVKNEVKLENADKVTPESEKKSGNGWAKVTIGGVAGILMGAGGMYAGKPYVDEMLDEGRESLANFLEENGMEVPDWIPPHRGGEIAQGGEGNPDNDSGEGSSLQEPIITTGTGDTTGVGQSEPQVIPPSYVPDGLHVASVDQNLSFGHAFAQARAEVGPGGVFHWHGGVYNTYTEEEWNGMSSADRMDFAHQVAPAIYHHADYTEDMAHQVNPDVTLNETEIPDVVIMDTKENESTLDTDVHILGVNQYVDEDGNVANAGFATIDGEPVVMIDVDGDGKFDGLFHDDNDNGQIDNDEVVDVTSLDVTTDAWASEAIAQGNSMDGTFNPEHIDASPQDELASSMPDYTNDADVSDLYIA